MSVPVLVSALVPSDMDAGIAAHYGDPLREQRLLHNSVGLVDRSNRGVLSVSGTDRLAFLHSLLSQHLANLSPFTGTEALLLSPHGHVEQHTVLLDDATTTWLDVEPGRAPSLVDFLNRMRFLMRVDLRDVSDEFALYSLVGPQASAAAARLGAPDLASPLLEAVPGPKFADGTLAAAPTCVYAVAALPSGGFARRMRYGVDLLLPRTGVSAAVAALGVPPAGIWAFEALRVASRQPRLGREVDHRTLPAEVGWLATSVHLAKGCYRGQESVARVHHLGRPPRRLVLLHLDGITTDELPSSGTEVTTVDGRVVGFVGTAVRHFELGPVALAVLKRSVPDDAQLRVGPAAAAIDISD